MIRLQKSAILCAAIALVSMVSFGQAHAGVTQKGTYKDIKFIVERLPGTITNTVQRIEILNDNNTLDVLTVAPSGTISADSKTNPVNASDVSDNNVDTIRAKATSDDKFFFSTALGMRTYSPSPAGATISQNQLSQGLNNGEVANQLNGDAADMSKHKYKR